jgi:site-specific DNA-methyltransferase (adenine-specific)
MLLDAVFSPIRFRNEVIWKRTHAHGSANRWGDVHDVILFYSKSNTHTWTRLLQAHDETYLAGKYRFLDDRGRYRLVVLTGPGTRRGTSGQPWRGYDPTKAGRHWAVPHRALAVLQDEGFDPPAHLHEQLDAVMGLSRSVSVGRLSLRVMM